MLKVPEDFEIDEVTYKVKNASRLFEKDKAFQKINLINGPSGKELHVVASKLPPGFYQLYVKVKDRKKQDHDYKSKYKDQVMFVVDSSLQVPIPNSQLNDKTVAGIDSDEDGIRDDVQRWINENFASQPRIKLAVKQVAIGKQLDLLSAFNKEQSIITSHKILNDSSCLVYVAGTKEEARLYRELKSKILNTKERLYADLKANSNFSGQRHSVPRNDEERKVLCDFNPDVP